MTKAIVVDGQPNFAHAFGVMRERWSELVRAVTVLTLAFFVAGCSPFAASSPVAWGDRVPTPDPAAVVNQPVLARGSTSITLLPISPSGATIGVAYGYDTPHCGIGSPIDVDGSFWDAIGIAPDSSHFDGLPGTFRLVSANTAEFTSADGQVLNLVRHEGSKGFRFCM